MAVASAASMSVLRIADQNSLFSAFDQILSSILERAAASGALDRGMEDIVADDVVVLGEEVIRTDAVTGAETRLLRCQVRTRRGLTVKSTVNESLSDLLALHSIAERFGET